MKQQNDSMKQYKVDTVGKQKQKPSVMISSHDFTKGPFELAADQTSNPSVSDPFGSENLSNMIKTKQR